MDRQMPPAILALMFVSRQNIAATQVQILFGQSIVVEQADDARKLESRN